MTTKIDKLPIVIAISVFISIYILVISPSEAYANTPPLTITPTNLNATAESPTQITLSWLPPTQNYGKTIVGYKIEQEIGGGVYYVLIENTNSTFSTYSLTGLKTGTTYTFRISAVYSDSTTTDPSKPVSATPSITSTPTPVSTSSSGSNARFDFTPSDGTTLTDIILTQIDYQQLQYKKDSRSIISNLVNTNQPVNNDLNEVLTYQNDHKSSPAVPGPLVATAVSPTQIDLFWLGPTETYGQNIIGYRIEWKQAPGDYVSIEDNTGNDNNKYSIGGLITGTTYTYRVSAILSSETQSNPSNEASATPLASSQPVSHVPTPTNASTSTQSNQSSSAPSNFTNPTQPVAIAPQTNIRFDFTPADGTVLTGVILTQSDYQQLIVIKDPRSIISNVTQTTSTINNDVTGILRYQTIHTPQSPQQTNNTPSQPPSNGGGFSGTTVLEGVVTSVIAIGTVGMITWFVRTKIAKKIAKDYYFTLEKFSENDIEHVRIRNSGQTIEDCTISCDKVVCYWTDTNIDRPRHIYEGSVSAVRLPVYSKNTNPLIIVMGGKRTLKKINLDNMAHG